MKLKAIGIKNFRKLENVLIDVDNDKTFFVGPNNSGKTSSTEVLRLFLSSASNLFTIHDFSSGCWKKINELGSNYFDNGVIDSDIELKKCVDNKHCFILTAGAGSGKTTSLIKLLDYIIKEKGNILRKNRQKIACINICLFPIVNY